MPLDNAAGTGALLSRLSAAALGRSVDPAPRSPAAVQAATLARTDCADPLQLVEGLHTDPGIVARVMRRVNPPALGPRGKLTALDPDGVPLGARRLAGMALIAAVASGTAGGAS